MNEPAAVPVPPLVPTVETEDELRVKGLTCMVISCFMFAGLSCSVYQVQLWEPEASVLVSSFARIVVNLLVLVGTGIVSGNWFDLFGDRRPSLWWRGVFGSLALICSFTSMRAIGIGESSFLNASNGVFVAAMAPFVLKQPNSAKVWIAVGGALIGLFLLFEPRLGDAHPYGRLLGIASGFFAALAYVMIARAGRSNSPNSVIFYFCIVAFVLHAILFLTTKQVWPVLPKTYALLVVAGLLGSSAQVFLTKAYQMAPAASNSAVSYLQPVLNLLFGVLLFGSHPDGKAMLGAGIVLTFGVALPFVRIRRDRPD